jgi:hypothetical protein
MNVLTTTMVFSHQLFASQITIDTLFEAIRTTLTAQKSTCVVVVPLFK